MAADGSFAVADAPGGRERVQVFGAGGHPHRRVHAARPTAARVGLGTLALSGVGTSFTGRSLVLSEPDTGWLLTEYTTAGDAVRSDGRAPADRTGGRPRGPPRAECGASVPEPSGGFFFVFLAGPPAFRKYSASGSLLFERAIQGRELDPCWRPCRSGGRGVLGDREVPLVPPAVRTAAVDPDGLWVSFVLPYTYVYDPEARRFGRSSSAPRASCRRPA